MKKLAIVVLLMTVVAFAATTVYDVELSCNDNFVASEVWQTFIATADTISEAAFFCGRKIVPGNYVFLLEEPDGTQIGEAYSDSAGLFECELVLASFSPEINVRRGFAYRLHVKHNQDSLVNFYYNSTDPYPGGQLVGQPDSHDLAARIKGVNDFPTNIFGVHTGMTITLYDGPPYTFRYPEYWKPCIDSMQAMGIKWERTGICGWQHFQFDSVDIDTFHHAWFDTMMTYFAQDSINVLWYFFQCTQWSKSNDKDPAVLWGRSLMGSNLYIIHFPDA